MENFSTYKKTFFFLYAVILGYAIWKIKQSFVLTKN